MTGTAVELLLLQHDEGPLRLVPLGLLGLGLVKGRPFQSVADLEKAIGKGHARFFVLE